MTEIRVPTLGESVTEATIGRWFKKAGDEVKVDEPLVELETDKVTIEVPAPTAGVLSDIAVKDGETVAVGALLGRNQAGCRSSRIRCGTGKSGAAASGGACAAAPTAPPAPAKAPPADAALAPSVRKTCDRDRDRSVDRGGHRQRWPRDQGRHAGRDRTRRCAAATGRAAGGRRSGARALAARRCGA